MLDHFEHLELAGDAVVEHFDSRMALARLGEGLFWLYESVKALEQRAHARAAREDVQIQIMGPIVDGIPAGFVSCAFQWYTVSACNYAQLVGWLATGESRAAKAYMARILPRVSRYRNKVAAHFALADPRRDNEADLAASVMTHTVYAHGRLFAAVLTPVVRAAGHCQPTARGSRQARAGASGCSYGLHGDGQPSGRILGYDIL